MVATTAVCALRPRPTVRRELYAKRLSLTYHELGQDMDTRPTHPTAPITGRHRVLPSSPGAPITRPIQSKEPTYSMTRWASLCEVEGRKIEAELRDGWKTM